MSLDTLQSSAGAQVGEKRAAGKMIPLPTHSTPFSISLHDIWFTSMAKTWVIFHFLATKEGGGDLWPPSLCLALKNWYHMLGSQSLLYILYYHWQSEFGGYHPCWPFSMWDATFWLHCPLIENIRGGCCLYEDTRRCHKLWNEGKAFKKLILH